MGRPKAYEPEQGYMYQILFKSPYDREYEHCDYAKDREERDYLLREYRLVGQGVYKAIQLPQKYWKE